MNEHRKYTDRRFSLQVSLRARGVFEPSYSYCLSLCVRMAYSITCP